MHIDLNSCFATVEQQANPLLRGKPIAVAAYTTSSGCILAASIEAKKLGIKTGMRVRDGKALCQHLFVLPPDPPKYRDVHLKLRNLLGQYTDNFHPKSIDEFVLNLEGYPALRDKNMQDIAREIKRRIKTEIGDWLTVSIGIAPNRFLAKLGSNLQKPDGLEVVDKNNFLEVYKKVGLTDFHGINTRNAARLNAVGIHTAIDFYESPIRKLKAAFNSILGYYFYVRLRGWELDDVEFARRSYGNSYSIPEDLITPQELSPILAKLVTKTSARLRSAGFKAQGVHLSMSYKRGGGYWHHGKKTNRELFDTRDIYKEAFRILLKSPCKKPVATMSVSCFNLSKRQDVQLELFEDVAKKENLTHAMDKINERWGSFVLTPGRMIQTEEAVPDRIAFGNVKELEEFTLRA